ncbi:MAG: hypothetical protein FD180_1195 [Planctomycetota bacterium]|nr:MAG: hypothetical protein FD180_1195 [Planctomycetota bacterium]
MALRDKGFCHAKNHNGNGNNPTGCRDRLIWKWPQLKKAFAALDAGDPVQRQPPEMKVTVNNTGK